MQRYEHVGVERKWQERWERDALYRADESGSAKEKFYVLDMFPYPSGEGLHVGHVEGYTATDVVARHARMNGKNVLHPMGWDAFGLPAENYAIKTKVHPRETTARAIENFRKQIKSLGLSYDWEREIGTHTPEYYRFTQWFFLFLYENGLAYKKRAKVNWCESCKTVLANEQVEGGRCERCKNEVVQKDLEQWFFKITEFAEDLIAGLDTVDWPESTKAAQKNWIGKSEGAEIEFGIRNPATSLGAGQESGIKVFTTRPDTLFGATYLVLAPEHEFVRNQESEIKNWREVEEYIEKTKRKTELERTADSKEKTGVELKGIRAVNPATGEEIPVFIADYVLAHYGTGAIMAVPAHDERDFAFAKKLDLPIVCVINPDEAYVGVAVGGDVSLFETKKEVGETIGRIKKGERVYVGPGTLMNSRKFDGLDSEESKKKIIQEFGKEKITYKLRDWLVSRQRYWGAPIPIIYCETCGMIPVPEKDLPVLLPDDVDFMPTGESPLMRSKSFHDVSCPSCDAPARRESDTMDTFVCSSWYFFRFADPKNSKEFASKQALERWLPVDLYVGGAEHTVLHLLYARFFTKALARAGLIGFDEPFRKLRHQGLILAEDGRKMSKSLGNVVNPDDVVETYGADTLRLYELFLGPLEDAKPWSTESIIGPRRFIERVWRAVMGAEERVPDAEEERILHETIRKVGDDIAAFKFNTAVSAMMVFVNETEARGAMPKESARVFVRLLAPFAPHVAEELWEKLGETSSVHNEAWPRYDAAKTLRTSVSIAVQVNGKLRGLVEVPPDCSEDEAVRVALENPSVSRAIGGRGVAKVVYVQGRLISLILGDS